MKRILSILLAVVMCLSITTIVGTSAGAYTAEAKAKSNGLTVTMLKNKIPDATKYKTQDVFKIYFNKKLIKPTDANLLISNTNSSKGNIVFSKDKTVLYGTSKGSEVHKNTFTLKYKQCNKVFSKNISLIIYSRFSPFHISDYNMLGATEYLYYKGNNKTTQKNYCVAILKEYDKAYDKELDKVKTLRFNAFIKSKLTSNNYKTVNNYIKKNLPKGCNKMVDSAIQVNRKKCSIKGFNFNTGKIIYKK